LIETQDKYDLLVIPGGAKGAETMSKSPTVQELVRRYIQEKKFVGMICAGMFSVIPSFQTLWSHFLK
jgi:protein DJ-1